MRLAFCVFKYYPFGGLERDFLRIAKACRAAGHEVHVFTMHWTGPFPEDFQITILPISAWSNHARALEFSQKVNQLFQQSSFDLVIGFNRIQGLDVYFAADTCYQEQTRRNHGWWYRYTSRFRIYTLLEKAVFSPHSQTEILLLNPRDKKYFATYYHTPLKRFHAVTPGIGKDRGRPENHLQYRQQLRASMNIAANEFVLLMVGSDYYRKGVDRAIRALASLSRINSIAAQLWVVGSGYVPKMQRLATSLGVGEQVKFFGSCDEVLYFYAAADLLIHPARQETAGMVLLEAIASGLPSLVTENCGYASYVIEAGAGQQVDMPFQQEQLNQHLAEMLKPEILQQYQAHAVDYVAQHDLFHFEEHIMTILEKLGHRKRKQQ